MPRSGNLRSFELSNGLFTAYSFGTSAGSMPGPSSDTTHVSPSRSSVTLAPASKALSTSSLRTICAYLVWLAAGLLGQRGAVDKKLPVGSFVNKLLPVSRPLLTLPFSR